MKIRIAMIRKMLSLLGVWELSGVLAYGDILLCTMTWSHSGNDGLGEYPL